MRIVCVLSSFNFLFNVICVWYVRKFIILFFKYFKFNFLNSVIKLYISGAEIDAVGGELLSTPLHWATRKNAFSSSYSMQSCQYFTFLPHCFGSVFNWIRIQQKISIRIQKTLNPYPDSSYLLTLPKKLKLLYNYKIFSWKEVNWKIICCKSHK